MCSAPAMHCSMWECIFRCEHAFGLLALWGYRRWRRKYRVTASPMRRPAARSSEVNLEGGAFGRGRKPLAFRRQFFILKVRSVDFQKRTCISSQRWFEGLRKPGKDGQFYLLAWLLFKKDNTLLNFSVHVFCVWEFFPRCQSGSGQTVGKCQACKMVKRENV